MRGRRCDRRGALIGLAATLLAGLPSLPGCTGGGGGSSLNLAPLVPWAGFRRDPGNSALALGSLKENPGIVRSSLPLGEGPVSAPALGLDDRLYVGTASGLVALVDTGTELSERWRAEGIERSCAAGGAPCESDTNCGPGDRCACRLCDPGPAAPNCDEVGPISATPALTPGRDIVAAARRGLLFALHDPAPGDPLGDSPECLWALTTATGQGEVTSSPKVLAEVLDNRIGQVVLGLPEGRLAVFNGNGTSNWSYPESVPLAGPITSTAAISGSGDIWFTGPLGDLFVLNPGGRLRWSAATGGRVAADGRMPSPAVAAVGYVADGPAVLALNADGSLRWRVETETAVAGSPVFAAQLVDVIGDDGGDTGTEGTPAAGEAGATPAPQASPEASQTPSPTPSPTPVPPAILDTVVYAVDSRGTLYAIRDGTGALLRVRRLGGQTVEARLPLDVPAAGLAGDPVVSADLFVVYGTQEGFLYARRTDGAVPCDGQCIRSARFCRSDADCDAGDTCERATACGTSQWSTCSLRHCAGDLQASCETDADCTEATGPCTTLTCSLDSDCPEHQGGETCRRQSRIDLGEPLVGEPTIDDEGNLYVVTASGVLHAIGAPGEAP